MNDKPKFPWHLATNERYRDVVKHLTTLATAALLLPGFLARDFLGLNKDTPLRDAVGWPIYVSWLFLIVCIGSGVVFHYLSAKWVRLAWGRTADVWGKSVQHTQVERALHVTFWLTAGTFLFGLAFAVAFLFGYGKAPNVSINTDKQRQKAESRLVFHAEQRQRYVGKGERI